MEYKKARALPLNIFFLDQGRSRLKGMIIVFGSLNIDMVMPVDHFPKPGETVLSVSDYLTRPGGKGSNQAVAAGRAGAKVAVVGKVGDDGFGRRCINNLKKQSIWASGIGISERPTGCATITVNNHGENMVLVAPGANYDTTSDQVPDEILSDKNTLLTQMEVTPSETWNVIARAYERRTRVILNASPAGKIPHEIIDDLDFLIMNELEAHQVSEGLGIGHAETAHLARKLADLGDLTCIITMEDKGSIAANRSEIWRVGALPVVPVDTTGAGDAYCGIFAAALEAGDDLQGAMHRASVGASLSCLGMGAQSAMPFAEDIDARLSDLPPPALITL